MASLHDEDDFKQPRNRHERRKLAKTGKCR